MSAPLADTTARRAARARSDYALGRRGRELALVYDIKLGPGGVGYRRLCFRADSSGVARAVERRFAEMRREAGDEHPIETLKRLLGPGGGA